MTEVARTRRPYNSPVRREQAAATRERIIAAGAELLHGFPTWNWWALTVPAVAERAGVNERTVYRYFPNERALRDAVMERLTDEADVHVETLTLASMRDLTARMLEYVSTFPMQERAPRDETVAAANARQREALLNAVGAATRGWSKKDRAVAAALLDVLWSVVSYERLMIDWELAPKDAIRGVTWVMGLIEEAIRADRRPGS